MRKFLWLFISIVFLSCGTTSRTVINKDIHDVDFTIVFGSCYNQEKECNLWPAILESKADVWIWGGDIVYSDTDNMRKLARDYAKINEIYSYKKLKDSIVILGTWDDHDYGLNDGGKEFPAREQSKQEFLNFLGVDDDDERRIRDGVYHSQLFETEKGSINIILLDTRYNRTELTKSDEEGRRYDANTHQDGTILGESQWKWLENELFNSRADYNVIVSSIQYISKEHGYEKWANMPNEVVKMDDLIARSRAKGVMFLSGDRHISEFSRKDLKNVDYSIIDFTSSGMTHSYTDFKGEPNKYRIGKVFSEKSFGRVLFNMGAKVCTFEIVDDSGIPQRVISQQY